MVQVGLGVGVGFDLLKNETSIVQKLRSRRGTKSEDRPVCTSSLCVKPEGKLLRGGKARISRLPYLLKRLSKQAARHYSIRLEASYCTRPCYNLAKTTWRQYVVQFVLYVQHSLYVSYQIKYCARVRCVILDIV